MAESKRKKLEVLRAQLESERATFLPHWRDLGDYVFPRRPRLNVTDVNKGDRRNSKIIDSTATLAARTLRSGMMSGVTSPARPWFRLSTPDPDLAEFGPVKEWLHVVGKRMSGIYLKSNLYNILPIVYGDIGLFATGAMMIEEDFEDVIRNYSFPIGSYCIANDDRLKVRVFYREFRMMVRQIVQKFGQTNNKTGSAVWENFSQSIKNAWDRGEYETWVNVRHMIQPNEEYDEKKSHSKYKKFSSCYYESGAGGTLRTDDDNKYLRESGYNFFPVLCPRWELTGEDVYGTSCPGMDALGDIKQLQTGEKRIAQAIEKMVNPPMTGPTSLRNSKATILPGDITYLDTREGQQGFRAAHEVNIRINEVEQKQAQIRERIQRAFFEDLFLMLANSDRRQITAREIEERHEEKLLALGPVLERLNQDLLDPLIDNTWSFMDRQGLIPPPPPDIEGVDLKIEYISVMAQAQKLVGIGGMDRFLTGVGQVAQFQPEVLDKIDTDQWVDEYGDALGVSPNIVRSDEKVEEIRAQKQKAQQAQAQSEMIAQGAMTAKNLSQAEIGEGDNALNRLIEQGQAGAAVPAQ